MKVKLFKTFISFILVFSSIGHSLNSETTSQNINIAQLKNAYLKAEKLEKELNEKKGWVEAYRAKKDTFEKYVDGLFQIWAKTPQETPEVKEIEEELIFLRSQYIHRMTERGMQVQNLFAKKAKPMIIKNLSTTTQANFLALMTQPGAHQRLADKMAVKGTPTEPFGWEVQATHSLALMRAGQHKKARTENKKLLLKTGLLIRGNERYEQQYFLHRALIEAKANKLEEAKKFQEKFLSVSKGESPTSEISLLQAELRNLLQE